MFTIADFNKTNYLKAAENGRLQNVIAMHEFYHKATNQEGRTALHVASAKNNFEIVQFLLKDRRTNVETKDHRGFTALHLAAMYDCVAVAKYLVQTGRANVDAATAGDARLTPLHAAVYGNNIKTVQCLVESCGANVEAKSANGLSPLHSATVENQLGMVKYLVERARANVSATDNENKTALHYAAIKNCFEIMQYLLESSSSSSSKTARINLEAANAFGATALYNAVSNNHFEMAQYLVQVAHANARTKATDGYTLLHCASGNGNLSMLQFLIETCHIQEGDDDDKSGIVNASSDRGYTALMVASAKGHLAVVQYLVENCAADTSLLDEDGDSALACARHNGHDAVASYLQSTRSSSSSSSSTAADAVTNTETLVHETSTIGTWAATTSSGSNGNQEQYWKAAQHGDLTQLQTLHEACYMKRNEEDRTALHLASAHNQRDIVQFLLQDRRTNVEARDINDFTPLLLAVAYNHVDMVQLLENEGRANVEAKNGAGLTALQGAVIEGNMKMVQCLVQSCRANVDGKSDQGKTALHFAAAHNRFGIVRYLIESAHANVQATADDGATALLFAASKNHVEICRYLLETCNVDVEAVNDLGITALYTAVSNNHMETVQFLVEKGHANANAFAGFGYNPLHSACLATNVQMAEYLVETGGANVNAPTTSTGQTALHFASAKGSLPLVQFLVDQHGADISILDKDGESALDVARKKGQKDVVTYLITKGNIAITNCVTATGLPNPLPAQETLAVTSEHDPVKDTAPLSNPSSATTATSGETSPMNFSEFANMMQTQNQLIEELFACQDKLSAMNFTDSQHDVLILMIGQTCQSQEEEDEKRAILASPEHAEFYLLLARKLYCMINAFEVLSSGMVASSGSKDSMRSTTARMLQEKGGDFVKGTKIGVLLSDIVGWVRSNVAAVPFLDTAGSICQLILTLKEERDRYMGVARVADFATMVSIQTSSSGGACGLRATIERFARVMVRARRGMPSRPFVETRDEFGKFKQLMLKMLGESANTPAKEQACRAADCCFAHLMRPTEGSILYEIFLDGSLRTHYDISWHEALAAATLETTIEEIQKLDRISLDGVGGTPTASLRDESGVPPSMSDRPNGAQPSLRESESTTTQTQFAGEASSAVSAEHFEQQSSDIARLQREINLLKKQAKDRKDTNRDAGGGLMYADHREEYKDTVENLVDQTMDHRDQIALLTEEVARLRKEREEVTMAANQGTTGSLAPQDSKRRGWRGFMRKR